MKKGFALDKDTLSEINKLDKLIKIKCLGIRLIRELYKANTREEKVIQESMPFIRYLICTIPSKESTFKEENTSAIMEVKELSPFIPVRFKSGFIGENLTLEEYSSLNEDEKICLQSTLWEKNGDWITQKFQELNASWITVVDGERYTFSSDIDKYPQRHEILNICEKRKKFPFIFINKGLLAIEETSSKWSKTVYHDDYYPTAEIQISSSISTLKVKITADFDTGADELYVDMDRLISEELMTPASSEEVPDEHQHLGKIYRFYTRHLCVGIVPKKGKIKKVENFLVFCIRDWGKSPFVSINSNRAALIGRRLFLRIGCSVVLHFANRKTEIY